MSHDRFFVNKIADSLLIFKKGKVSFYDGSYEKYELEKCKQENQGVEEISIEKKEKTTNNTYLMQKEKNRNIAKSKKLEREITELENKVKEYNQELLNEDNFSNYEKISEIQNKIDECNNLIEVKMEEWETLESMINTIFS